MNKTGWIVGFLSVLLLGCAQPLPPQNNAKEKPSGVTIPYERYQLENGLTVILHQDTSDPLVHVDVTYHVGSAREDVGHSGFAHFFEHMMFQGSAHVADEQHFSMITEAGGDMNGTTNSDRTNYYQTVPRNHLEKVLWLESDRMGFLLPAVTQQKFENQRETVKNERAQRIDNQPYGLRSERISEALYPAGHPYSWPVIGYVEDLDRVGVDDLKAFFQRWYGPNNAILTIGGDIDIEQTKRWVKKYFGEIPRGPEVERQQKTPVKLDSPRYLTLEDNVHLPFIQMTFPTVYARHPDEAPLDVLADILGGGKTSIFYKNLVVSGKTVQAGVSHPCRELACEFQLLALANPAVTTNLDSLYADFYAALEEFEVRGVQQDDLDRVKMSIEAGTIFGLQSVARKVSSLANGQLYAGEPDLVQTDIDRYNAVTKDDVMRVYEQYIKNNPAVVLSIVPEGQTAMAVQKPNYSVPARELPANATTPVAVANITTQSQFDRSVIPATGPAPVVNVPDFWEATYRNNIPVLGAQTQETPTVTLAINLEGGPLLDPTDKAGLASMTAQMLNESSQARDSITLANELAKLGSSIRFGASGRFMTIYASSLTKNLQPTLDILLEKLLTPAFLASDFAQIQQRTLQAMQQQLKSPNILASRARDLVNYGKQNRVSLPDDGVVSTVSNITLDDVKQFYATFVNPDQANIVVVGDIDKPAVMQLLTRFDGWLAKPYSIPQYAAFPEYEQANIFLVDKPNAVQSVVDFTQRSLPYDATGEFFRMRLMNFPLGGNFNSRINLNLREDKGFTYGAGSSFSGGKTLGVFSAGGDMNALNTLDSINEIISEIQHYKAQGPTEGEMALMKNAFTQSDALRYETPSSKSQFLRHLLVYDLDRNYTQKQLEIINSIDAQTLQSLAQKHLVLDDMQLIVVGDAQALRAELESLKRPIIELDVPN
ncbi:M16 family metallopeptidase [Alteromonas oceanisediminis]|uniref:M16 family metallopeptidase n=1 Tax=Alteromonas oceanisediminis TaxID=2836180 RepID=UPI001BD9B1A5|nr:pitrilysin family protein [Alteromonas oceanisediminis]MBT0584833.1 insulinase family protein [Alteromonas oceanisediminis]